MRTPVTTTEFYSFQLILQRYTIQKLHQSNKSHSRHLKGCNVYADKKAEGGRGGNFPLFSINSLWLFRCLLSAKYSGFQLSAQTLSAGIRQEVKYRKRKEFNQKNTQIPKACCQKTFFRPICSLDCFQIPLPHSIIITQRCGFLFQN